MTTWKKLPDDLREEVYNLADGHCAYCSKKLDINDFHVDHVVSQANGGNSKIDNLLPSCHSCNPRKNNKNFEEFKDWVTDRLIQLIETDFQSHLFNCRHYMSSDDYDRLWNASSDLAYLIRNTQAQFFIERLHDLWAINEQASYDLGLLLDDRYET